MYDVRQLIDTLEETESGMRVNLIPQVDLFRHELWEFGTDYFSYCEASFSVHFHIAIVSSIFQINVHVLLNICVVY